MRCQVLYSSACTVTVLAYVIPLWPWTVTFWPQSSMHSLYHHCTGRGIQYTTSHFIRSHAYPGSRRALIMRRCKVHRTQPPSECSGWVRESSTVRGVHAWSSAVPSAASPPARNVCTRCSRKLPTTDAATVYEIFLRHSRYMTHQVHSTDSTCPRCSWGSEGVKLR